MTKLSFDQNLVWQDEHLELYLGEEPDSYDGLPFDIIVNCTGWWPGSLLVTKSPWFRSKIPVLMLHMEDTTDPKAFPPEHQIVGILGALVIMIGFHRLGTPTPEQPTRVYFHCWAGLNRSAYMLARYLRDHKGLPAQGAIDLIRQARSDQCLSNELFVQKLLTGEKR